jgi:hypothetical protein
MANIRVWLALNLGKRVREHLETPGLNGCGRAHRPTEAIAGSARSAAGRTRGR